MSWFKTAVSKAVEVGNKNNITRNIKNYADTVVHHAGQAVAEGAKILQDRIVARNFKSVKQTIKRLEEAAVSCRGPERVMLLRRWLVVLKEIDKLSAGSSEDKEKNLEQLLASDEVKQNSRVSLVLYYDSDVGGEPMNFREVFLQSQALEGIIISMILEAPNEEEISLLREMFGLCLTGGKEVHIAILSSIQDLASAFSGYHDEVLVKREELLQFAQVAITGLKINAEVIRMDAEASGLKKKLDQLNISKKSTTEGDDVASEEMTAATIEALKKALAQIRICSGLEGILLRKKFVSNGDSAEVHSQKMEKLKVLSDSLANSSVKAEKRIVEHRLQKEEALKVRVNKASEADGKEKEIAAEISELEKERDDLEAKLKKVNISLAAAQARFRNAREERDQFDEANNQVIAHLKMKEDELSKSLDASRLEAEVLKTWINFLDDTWAIQCSYRESKDKQVSDELEKHEEYFVNLAINLLSGYKEQLGPAISRIEKFVENLKKFNERQETASIKDDVEKELNPRKHLEEEYLNYEAKIITTFSIVDNMKEHFCAQQGTVARKDEQTVKGLFDDIEKLRTEFEAMERPNLEMENPSPRASPRASSPTSPVGTSSPKANPPPPSYKMSVETGETKGGRKENPETTNPKAETVLDHEAEIARLESEFGKDGQDYSGEEIGDWEFDELERELRSADSASTK